MLDTIKTRTFPSFRRNVMTEKSYKIWGYTSHFFTQARKRATYRLRMTNNQSGNAMIYVLIALALFGFLTLTLSRSNNQADGQDIDDEQAELYALELMEYAASAQAVVDQMLFSGSEIDDLDFVIPSDSAFNTPPHHHKVYHPQGGGLSYKFELPEAISNITNASWRLMTTQNTEWTPTSNSDVILTAIYIPKIICENINRKITGSIAIPSITNILSTFSEGVSTDSDLTILNCPECEGKTNLCVINSSNDRYAYYNIIAAQ